MFLKKKEQKYKKSYSQVGEDMIIDFLFEIHGISKPSYIDIGAHDPYYYSNTAYFYSKGCKGINIEPNPVLFKNFLTTRKDDINLNIGIGGNNNRLNFYIMSTATMSTFSKEQATELVSKHGFSIEDVIKVDVSTLNSVVDDYNGGIFPDFLSLDAEGLDFDILQMIDYEKNYPKVICVETIVYNDMNGKKEDDIIDFLQSKGYKIFADTYINTIFEKF